MLNISNYCVISNYCLRS